VPMLQGITSCHAYDPKLKAPLHRWPLPYYNKKAWIDGGIFNKWFDRDFFPEVQKRAGCCVLLLLDTTDYLNEFVQSDIINRFRLQIAQTGNCHVLWKPQLIEGAVQILDFIETTDSYDLLLPLMVTYVKGHWK